MSAESASSSDTPEQKRRRRGRRGGRGRRKPSTGAPGETTPGAPTVETDDDPAAMNDKPESEAAEPSAPRAHSPKPHSPPPGEPVLVDDATAREMELRARLAREEQRGPAAGGPVRDQRPDRPLRPEHRERLGDRRGEPRGEPRPPRPPREPREPRPPREPRVQHEAPPLREPPAREPQEPREERDEPEDRPRYEVPAPPPPRDPAPKASIEAAIQEALDAIEKLKGALGDVEYVLELLEDVQVQQQADVKQIEHLHQQLRSITSRDDTTREAGGGRDRDRGRDGGRGRDRRQDDRPRERPPERAEARPAPSEESSEGGAPPPDSDRGLAD